MALNCRMTSAVLLKGLLSQLKNFFKSILSCMVLLAVSQALHLILNNKIRFVTSLTA